ncbi:hypothetical protein EVAR_91555_1 [Eumeta japonica]|uniref:Uncharacterized protein n=1 Tax=Eumeta variegata TaxID=151549 RepID=A0A4C1XCU8_EUMVA|nr:hypothetical protein EVAR_91555_1 [Eumeta japonica]
MAGGKNLCIQSASNGSDLGCKKCICIAFLMGERACQPPESKRSPPPMDIRDPRVVANASSIFWGRLEDSIDLRHQCGENEFTWRKLNK